MSIAIAKSQIQKFLRSAEPEVLAIKGAWGVGKTYSWNKFLLDAKNENRIALDKYSYVSLFGINSLDALKYTIFEHVVAKDMIGTEANIDTFKNNVAGLLKGNWHKPLIWFRETSLLKNFAAIIEPMSFLSLNGSLICIDDLERRGCSLSMKDTLGLVSQLKEQKKCKVVLLLNDKEEGLEDYEKYREKVIDIELKFEPDASEIAEIAFDSSEEIGKTLSELTQKLGIQNIRVLKKIERLVKLITPLVAGFEPEVSDQVYRSLVLFSWCYYDLKNETPSLEFVTKISYGIWGLENEGEDEQKKAWKNIVGIYGYQNTDELDLVLVDAVKGGYVDEERFRNEASKKNSQILAYKSESSFREAWNSFDDSFKDNKEEVITNLHTSFQDNVGNISPGNLNGIVSFFKKLHEDEKASEVIDLYIETRKEETELFNLNETNLFKDVTDEEIISKFNQEYQKPDKVESISDVLNRISSENVWNPKDEAVLANITKEEYYRLFKTEEGPHLSLYVRKLLRFGQIDGASNQQRQIASRVTEALKRIATESELNKLRVKKYGVDVDE